MLQRRLPLFLPLFAAALLPAQREAEPRVLAPEWSLDQVQQRLASEQPVDVAWGGYCVAERGMQAALPAVRGALRRLASDPRSESLFARLLLLDALIGQSATLTLDELRAHPEATLREPLLILAARDPVGSRPFFVERFAADRSAPDLAWRVAGNQLAAAPEPGQVLDWLQSLVFSIRIRLHDTKTRYGCGGCRVACPVPELRLPADFPPIPVYRLDASNAESRANGLRCVPFARTRLLRADQLEPEPTSDQRALRDWLCSIGDRRTAAACDLEPVDRELTWTSVQQLRRVLHEERDRIVRAFQGMTAELVRNGRIPFAAAAALQPNLAVAVLDRRGEPWQRPLPPTETLLQR